MPKSLLNCLAHGCGLVLAVSPGAGAPPSVPPIKALLVSGGCSHDYSTRTKRLVQGIRERIVRPIEWVVRLDGVGESHAKIPLFESAEWAKGYDIVVHDHCFPRVVDPAYIDRVLAPHRTGTPAVLIHGSMLSFPAKDKRWSEFTGASLRGHERERAVRVEPLASSHPILKGFHPWAIPHEELYRVDTLSKGGEPLAEAADLAGKRYPVIWTHRYGPSGARVFASTLGNATATLADPVSLDLLARGFLWSLGLLEDSAIRSIPPAESLTGGHLPAASGPLLRPGRNAATGGMATGFQWGQAGSAEGAERGIDADPLSVWRPGGTGPGGWEVRFAKSRAISLVAVWWEGAPPLEVRLEGTSGGRTWKPLAPVGPPSSADQPVLVRFESRVLGGLRLSIDRSAPGAGFALREVAAYATEEDLPSALLAATPDPPGLIRFRAAGDGDRAGIRLAPGWKLERFEKIGLRGEPGQILPTAAGDLFLSLFPEKDSPGEVHRIEVLGETRHTDTIYLSGIAPDTRIAWDGEWLYTLSGAQLERVRKALGRGPADERQRLGTLWSRPGEQSPADLVWTDLRLGDDGWLCAGYRAASGGALVGQGGRNLRLSPEGHLRFRRDGSGVRPQEGRIATDPLAGVATIDGVLRSEGDGSRIWFVASRDSDLWLGILTPDSAAAQPPLDLDELPTETLAGRLEESARGTARREIALEFTRRKGEPQSEVDRLLATGASADLAEVLVAAVANLSPATARTHLIALTAPGGDSAVRAAAFRALGDVSGDLDPEVFRELGASTDPAVTAAIFEGMRRSGATLPGAETIALRLAHHPEADLARAAFAFLRDRGAVDVAFAALYEGQRRADWPQAFALLADFPDPGVVAGVTSRLVATRDPDLRGGLLDVLCRLRLSEGQRWARTQEIESRLQQALRDHRVDRVALLAGMEKNGDPPRDPDTLLLLAREIPSLESYVIARLAESASPIPAKDRGWLRELANDPEREERLRREISGLLGRSDSAPPAPSMPSAPTLAVPPPRDVAPSGAPERFRREGCAACHNLDGEGPSAGPDLVSLFAGLPESERGSRLQNPKSEHWQSVDTGDGRQWTVVREGSQSAWEDLVDLAGNRFSLPDSQRVGHPRPVAPDLIPCRRTADWSAVEIGEWLAWLKVFASF